MNASRAREHFSAYREGTLDAALRMAFERALQSDAQLQAEFQAFELALDDLDLMKYEEIEPPAWLSDRIATRLEEAQASRRKAPVWWTGWFRNLAFGGLAVAAIGGAVVGILSRGGNQATGNVIAFSGDPEPVAPVPSVASDAPIRYQVVGDHVQARSDTMVTVRSGELTSRFGGSTKGDLQNPNANPAVFSLQIQGKEFEIVVLPGYQTPAEPLHGEGTMVDFAQALSIAARKPVRLSAEAKDTRVSWDFSTGAPLDDANAALKSASPSISADEMQSGEIALR